VLKDVTITYSGEGAHAYRATSPILFAGSELLVVGTFDAAKGLGDATIKARGPDGARTYTAEPTAAKGNASFLPRLVAYHEIRRLQDIIDAEGARSEWTDSIETLALAHGFVTDYTSLVVTLEPRARPIDGCGGNCSIVVTDSRASEAPMDASASSGASYAASSGWQTAQVQTLGSGASTVTQPSVATTTRGTGVAPTGTTPVSSTPAEHVTSTRAAVPGAGIALAIIAAACALALLPRRK
jgi:hypothetical protein